MINVKLNLTARLDLVETIEQIMSREAETFQEECDRKDEEYRHQVEEIIPDDTPCLEIEGTVFDPSL